MATCATERPASMSSLNTVDWTKIPEPEDDGACAHLEGVSLPAMALSATDGKTVTLADLAGTTVVYIYPMTGRPDGALPEGWNDIPGARGCTPQSCAFRDHHAELTAAGASQVFGLSSQDTAYQREAAKRLHLPFTLLSDADGRFADALSLPTFRAEGQRLIKRITFIVDDGRISKVFYPVFPPDRNAEDVLAYLRSR